MERKRDTSTKATLFYIFKILQSTDEFHPMTAVQIGEQLLEDYHIDAERKSICRTISVLQEDCRVDIAKCEDNKKGYYLISRDFEDWELKLLNDLVVGTKFLSKKDSDKLIGKIKDLGSQQTQQLLKDTTPLQPVFRDSNSRIKQFIDDILNAINQHKQIKFQYLSMTDNKQKSPRYSGYIYIINPYALVYRNGFYYLICNLNGKENLSFYRLDRMHELEICKENRRPLTDLLGRKAGQNLTDFANRSLYSYGGKENITVTLEIGAGMREEIIDTYGQDVTFRKIPDTEDRYKTVVHVQDSQGLYYWLLQHADNVKVLAPDSVKEKLVGKIKNILALYE